MTSWDGAAALFVFAENSVPYSCQLTLFRLIFSLVNIRQLEFCQLSKQAEKHFCDQGFVLGKQTQFRLSEGYVISGFTIILISHLRFCPSCGGKVPSWSQFDTCMNYPQCR